jgi:sulfite reductase beta subunit-like hemoprotein
MRLVDIGLAEDHAMTISDVITCPGADTCSIGVTSSKGLGTEIRNRLLAAGDEYHKDPMVNDIRINISGCPNSCGQHHIADIGFYGMAIRMGERQVPAFQLMLGGHARGEGKLAKLTMKLGVHEGPDGLRRLGADEVLHPRRHGRRRVRSVGPGGRSRGASAPPGRTIRGK